MSSDQDSMFDTLGAREGEFALAIIERLRDVAWAASLLRRIQESGGVRQENKALLFELRFAYALHEAGVQADYEIQGEGNSTIDFGFALHGQPWAVELMRLDETAAARSATRTHVDDDGIEWSSRNLSSNAEQRTESEEGETLKAIERICQKCERGGRPHKFLMPAGQFNIALVGMHTFLQGGDEYDRIHIALGGEYLQNEFHRRYWNGQLISGVFSEGTTLRGANHARERLHFIGFVDEQEYAPGDFAANIFYVANPHLLTREQARQAIAHWPLPPSNGFGF